MPFKSPVIFQRRPNQGMWFPLVLAFLLVLLLPGLVLLLLSLCGLEGSANGWLQDWFALSYHNRLPLWATIVLLLMPIILVLLYFLKLRRRAIEVPSTLLWRKAIEDLHVNSLFQWLRDNVFLLVQLAIVLLLVYSSLGLQVHGSTSTSSRHYILLIDSSASMATTDVNPSRLDVAKEEALREIDARADTDTGMVIEFNSRPTILQPYTRDKALLRAAVRRISQTQRVTRISDALAMVDGLANPQRSGDNLFVRPTGENPAEARTYVLPDGVAADVHLYSDGRFADATDFAAGNLALKYQRVGAVGPEAVNNVGIVGFNAVRDEKDATKLHVFVRVLNFRPEAAPVTVELEWQQRGQAEFSLKDEKLTIPGRVVEQLNPEKKTEIRDTPGTGRALFVLSDVDESSDVVLRARLRGMRDQFPLDDEAWLVTGIVRKAKVLIVTPGNLALKAAFEQPATTKLADVTTIAPADLNDDKKYTQPARAGKFDLVIFDRCAPDKEANLPAANTFFIHDVPPPWTKPEKKLKTSLIRNPTSKHSLMRGLRGLDEIAFSDAFDFDLTDEAQPRVPRQVPKLLEVGSEKAVMFVLPRRSYQDVVLAFPLINNKNEIATSWVIKESFPLFCSNLLFDLGNVSDAAADENTQPGEPKALRGGDAEYIEVEFPDKRIRKVGRGTGGEFPFTETESVGVYRANWKGGTRSFAVNLLDAEESNTQPRDEIRVGEQEIVAGQERKQVYDTWKWVALAAIGMLLFEWAIYHRRTWV